MQEEPVNLWCSFSRHPLCSHSPGEQGLIGQAAAPGLQFCLQHHHSADFGQHIAAPWAGTNHVELGPGLLDKQVTDCKDSLCLFLHHYSEHWLSKVVCSNHPLVHTTHIWMLCKIPQQSYLTLTVWQVLFPVWQVLIPCVNANEKFRFWLHKTPTFMSSMLLVQIMQPLT